VLRRVTCVAWCRCCALRWGGGVLCYVERRALLDVDAVHCAVRGGGGVLRRVTCVAWCRCCALRWGGDVLGDVLCYVERRVLSDVDAVQWEQLIGRRRPAEHREVAGGCSSHGVHQGTLGLYRHRLWAALSDCLSNVAWQWRLQSCQYDPLSIFRHHCAHPSKSVHIDNIIVLLFNCWRSAIQLRLCVSLMLSVSGSRLA